MDKTAKLDELEPKVTEQAIEEDKHEEPNDGVVATVRRAALRLRTRVRAGKYMHV